MHDIRWQPLNSGKKIKKKEENNNPKTANHQELYVQLVYLEEIYTLFHIHLFAVFAACVFSTAAAALSYSTISVCANVI